LPTITADTFRRLAFIRLLLDRGVELSTQSAPFSFDSINRLHDVAEMFLALAVQVHGLAIPNDFMAYWVTLQKPLGRPLTYNAQMQRFNKVRVNLKHYGIEPSQVEIRAASTVVPALINDECLPIFGVKLDDVSLSTFINCDEARQLVDQADSAWCANDLLHALAFLEQAFDVLIRDYEKRKKLEGRSSVFDATVDMTFLTPFHRRVTDTKEKQFDDAIISSLNALDFSVMLIGIGIDFRRYGRFKAITPVTHRYMDGHSESRFRKGAPEPSGRDYAFCRDFVVSTAIHLAAFDYDLDWNADPQTMDGTSPD
jgi:hypothetical protein